MTLILVAYASRSGATREIAETIGAELTASGAMVTVANAADVPDVNAFDVVVVGSALYWGRWRRSAVRLLSDQVAALSGRPTWLFQSGPCSAETTTPDEPTPANVRRLVTRTGAHPPVTFGGRFTPEVASGWLARTMASRDEHGDFRDWDAIRRWARLIVAVAPVAAAPTVRPTNDR